MTVHSKLVDGEVVPASAEDLAQRDIDATADLQTLKADRIAAVHEDATRRVLAVLPDLDKAGAIRLHADQLAATLSAKLKQHTLMAVDITAGWPS